jgi:hypothetical protein
VDSRFDRDAEFSMLKWRRINASTIFSLLSDSYVPLVLKMLKLKLVVRRDECDRPSHVDVGGRRNCTSFNT